MDEPSCRERFWDEVHGLAIKMSMFLDHVSCRAWRLQRWAYYRWARLNEARIQASVDVEGFHE